MPEPMDQTFADFAARTAGTFRAVPVEAVASAVRRRRRTRHGALAALALAAIIAPVTLLNLGGRGETPPVVTPSTPAVTSPSGSPSAAPAPVVETRAVQVPGVAPDFPATVVFTDAEHGWALLVGCPSRAPACDQDDCVQAGHTCTAVLARTGDGGRTWHRVTGVPSLDGKVINLYALDGQTIALHLIKEKFLLTRDGGATFTTHPLSAPPQEAVLADARAHGHEGYGLACPGAVTFEDGASAPECERVQLYKIGSGPVVPQPQLGGNPNRASSLHRGLDGRFWLLTSPEHEGAPRIQLSEDGLRSWRQLPAPAQATAFGLVLSPDGAEVWLTGNTQQLWRLVGGAWQRQADLPAETQPHQVVALGGGILLAGNPSGVWRLQDGVFTQVPGLPGLGILTRLPDGTLFGYDDNGRKWLSPGTGNAADRPWIKIF
ncbi:hypothetical protein [Catellatospora sichuanensis]|uniref:hypothetical protein n=1 Tax=Catellatospora sichuanensis TaxID=1969805 RepID=UPI0011833C45|nr:hypothetical protein [Catellatospora sichuanensis]